MCIYEYIRIFVGSKYIENIQFHPLSFLCVCVCVCVRVCIYLYMFGSNIYSKHQIPFSCFIVCAPYESGDEF